MAYVGIPFPFSFSSLEEPQLGYVYVYVSGCCCCFCFCLLWEFCAFIGKIVGSSARQVEFFLPSLLLSCSGQAGKQAILESTSGINFLLLPSLSSCNVTSPSPFLLPRSPLSEFSSFQVLFPVKNWRCPLLVEQGQARLAAASLMCCGHPSLAFFSFSLPFSPL